MLKKPVCIRRQQYARSFVDFMPLRRIPLYILAALPVLVIPITWGGDERVDVAVDRAVAHDLPSIIDRFGI